MAAPDPNRRENLRDPPSGSKQRPTGTLASGPGAGGSTAAGDEVTAMTGLLYRLAGFCVRHRFTVLAMWLLVTVVLVGVSRSVGDDTTDSLTLPGTDSQRATDSLASPFPDQAN